MESEYAVYPLKMRALPKAEYALLQALCEEFGFDKGVDGEKIGTYTAYSKVFTVLLRLGYEVLTLEDAMGKRGYRWFVNVLDDYRRNTDVEKVYRREVLKGE